MKNQFSKLVSKFFVLAILVNFSPSSVNAQDDKSSNTFGKKSFKEGLIFSGTLGYNSYFGDLTEDAGKNILPFDNQSQFAFGLAIHKELFGFFELGIKSVFGKVKEVNSTKRPNTTNVYSFNSNITQVG
jgi:hypothetical protein